MDGKIRTDARWIAIGKLQDEEKAMEIERQFRESGYIKSAESNKIVILKKNRR